MPEGLIEAKFGLTPVVAVEVVSVILAVAVCDEFAILATVSTTVCNEEIVNGAVYTPFVMLPT